VSTPTPAEYRQTYLDQLAPHVPEPIIEVGFVSTPGLAASYVADALTGKAIYLASPLANRLFHRKKAEHHATTISNQLVAVTATSAYLFDFPTKGAFAVTGPPTVWLRSAITVTADTPGRMSQRLHVRFSSGEQVEVDINRSKGPWATFNEPMRELLLQPVTA
jgi:hypothetical protein